MDTIKNLEMDIHSRFDLDKKVLWFLSSSTISLHKEKKSARFLKSIYLSLFQNPFRYDGIFD